MQSGFRHQNAVSTGQPISCPTGLPPFDAWMPNLKGNVWRVKTKFIKKKGGVAGLFSKRCMELPCVRTCKLELMYIFLMIYQPAIYKYIVAWKGVCFSCRKYMVSAFLWTFGLSWSGCLRAMAFVCCKVKCLLLKKTCLSNLALPIDEAHTWFKGPNGVVPTVLIPKAMDENSMPKESERLDRFFFQLRMLGCTQVRYILHVWQGFQTDVIWCDV